MTRPSPVRYARVGRVDSDSALVESSPEFEFLNLGINLFLTNQMKDMRWKKITNARFMQTPSHPLDRALQRNQAEEVRKIVCPNSEMVMPKKKTNRSSQKVNEDLFLGNSA